MTRPRERYRWGVAKLPGGRYRVRLMVRGKIVKRTLPNKRMAELFRDQTLAARAGLKLGTAVTIKEALDAYREKCIELGLSGETLRFYDWQSVVLIRHLGEGTTGDLIQDDIRDYVSTRQKEGTGNATIIKELAHLRRVLVSAGVEVAWRAPKLKRVARTTHVYRDREVARLLLSADDPRLRRAILLGLLTGMRPSEVLRADSSWINWESLEIQIPALGQETSTLNRLPLVATLAGELAGVEGPLVPMTHTGVRGALLRRSRRLGIVPELNGLETFRHTAATWALEETGSQNAVDLILSHVVPGASRNYTKLAQAVAPKRAALELVERRLQRAIDLEVEDVKATKPT